MRNIIMGPYFISFLALGLIFVCQISTLHASGIPMVIWSDIPPYPTERNPFKNTAPEELLQIINGTLGPSQPPLVVFLKDDFCVEDITRSSEDLRSLKASSMQYVPAIESPLKILKDFPNYNETSDDDTDSMMLDRQIIIKSINELSNLPDSYDTVKQSNPNAVVILTGKTCRYSHRERTRRAVAATADTNVNNENLTELIIPIDPVKNPRVLYVSQYPAYQIPDSNWANMSKIEATSRGAGTEKDPLILSFYEATPSVPSLHKLVVDFKFFIKPAGYYKLRGVDFKANNSSPIQLTPNVDISFPFNFSYHCSQKITFSNKKKTATLIIKDLQLQIDASSTTFNDAYDCVGFTTIPIWMGIFVTAILALIMIWALTMIIDIRTMDRFDDPKGKTITISAQE